MRLLSRSYIFASDSCFACPRETLLGYQGVIIVVPDGLSRRNSMWKNEVLRLSRANAALTLSCVYSGMIGMSSARDLWSVHGGGRARDRPQPRTGAPPFFAPISALQRVLLCASDIGKDHKE